MLSAAPKAMPEGGHLRLKEKTTEGRMLVLGAERKSLTTITWGLGKTSLRKGV